MTHLLVAFAVYGSLRWIWRHPEWLAIAFAIACALA